MSELYTVSFTTKKLIKKIGKGGKVISETQLDTPIKMNALPYTTAMSYSGCDNFIIARYEFEQNSRHKSHGPGRDNSVGNGTKKSAYHHSVEATAVKTTQKSSTADAARTGNLGAALNA